PMTKTLRLLRFVGCVTLALVLTASVADARIGGGLSSGSRGFRTYSAPPSTTTAPSPAAPITRSQPTPSYVAPGSPPVGAPWGSYGGGFGRLLVGGLFGA